MVALKWGQDEYLSTCREWYQGGIKNEVMNINSQPSKIAHYDLKAVNAGFIMSLLFVACWILTFLTNPIIMLWQLTTR